MGAKYQTLDISIHRVVDVYHVDLLHHDPNSDALTTATRGVAALDLTELLQLEATQAEYGKALAKQLFSDSEVLRRFGLVEATAQARQDVLRVVLHIEPSAEELEAVRWELLRHPHSGAPLSTSETLLLSRSISSSNSRAVRLRPRNRLTALIAVSAPEPAKLQSMGLAPVDFEAEVERVRTALTGIEVRTLGGPGSPLTLNGLIEELRGGIDILYLVSHGMFGRTAGIPALILQDSAGEAKPVTGEDLALRIGELQEGPRLVVLASCQSAGDGTPNVADQRTAQVTIVGHLADAGVPAIMAMQGFITMETIGVMMPAFFAELLRDGQIDRALAVARGKIRERSDAWMPALYTRLTAGCLWDGGTEVSKDIWGQSSKKLTAEKKPRRGEVRGKFTAAKSTGEASISTSLKGAPILTGEDLSDLSVEELPSKPTPAPRSVPARSSAPVQASDSSPRLHPVASATPERAKSQKQWAIVALTGIGIIGLAVAASTLGDAPESAPVSAQASQQQQDARLQEVQPQDAQPQVLEPPAAIQPQERPPEPPRPEDAANALPGESTASAKVPPRSNKGRITIQMPKKLTSGEQFRPAIKVDRRLWLIVLYRDAEGNHGVVFPSPKLPAYQVTPGNRVELPAMIVSTLPGHTTDSETLIVYGFGEEADFRRFAPTGGQLSTQQANAYATKLQRQLENSAEISRTSWTSATAKYEIVAADG
jgi:hypothetical protein